MYVCQCHTICHRSHVPYVMQVIVIFAMSLCVIFHVMGSCHVICAMSCHVSYLWFIPSYVISLYVMCYISCHVSCSICHRSCVICPIMCHVSCVTSCHFFCHVSCVMSCVMRHVLYVTIMVSGWSRCVIKGHVSYML
jgi:hypothetical protein